MTFAETLHQARKARLERMGVRAVEKPQSAAAGRLALVHAGQGARHDRDYERAWAFEILGVIDREERPPRKLKVDDILCVVAREYRVARDDILSARHSRDVARPRHVAMYLARKMTTKSSAEIGRCFGRDPATVLHAVAGIEGLLACDGELADSVWRVRAALDEFQNE